MSPRHRLWVPKLPVLVAVLAIWVLAMWLRSRDRAPDTCASTPANREALRSLQQRVQAASQRVVPAVVAIELPRVVSTSSAAEKPRVFHPYGSGVIITADGLILSQFHVSHRFPGWDGRQPPTFRQPGDRTMVVLSDGRKKEAELLGADQTFDLSLLRLVEPGPYSYVSLDLSMSVELGDWVLKLGHPLGYRPDRPPVVRLGRVLFQNRDFFVTDCFTTGGDSGGPYFDLEGRLVGVILSSLVPAKLQGSLNSPDFARVGPFSSTTSRFIRRHLDVMLRREIAPFDEMAWQQLNDHYRRDNDENILPRVQWTQGRANAKAFQDVIRDSRPSVVSVLDEIDHEVAYGTIVEANGWIVTMASTLPAQPRCRLSDGLIVAAEVVGMDPAFDLALLKVPANDLQPVNWAEKPSPIAGTILAAAGMSEMPLAMGVVSVPQRNLPGPFPTRVTRPTIHAKRPGVFGKRTEAGYLVDRAVPDTGILQEDVILSIAGKDIHDDQDIFRCVEDHLAGERVPVRLIRGGQRQDLELVLGAVALTYSKPYADYPTLFEHDMPLLLSQCGGPVVDLNGEAVGITMYRGQYGCMAIPADCVKRLLPKLKSGGLAGKWIKPTPAGPDDHKPSSVEEESRKSSTDIDRDN